MSHVRTIPLLLLLLLSLALSAPAAEPRRVTVYAAQTSYQADVLVRDGVDYIGLTDLLEPLGHLESHVDGKRLRLIFNGNEAEFQDGRRQYRARPSLHLDLSANFLLVDGRGYVPTSSLVSLLSGIASINADFHSSSRRLFAGVSPLHMTVELRHSPSRLVLTFPVPVHPSTVSERGRLRIFFSREALMPNGAENVSYSDPFVLSSSFAEVPNGAEFVVSVLQPAAATLGDGGRTLTIAPGTTPASTASAAAPVAGAPVHTAGQHAHPFVILDAAHGGDENGSTLSPSLVEKNINLSIARRVQKELEAKGIQVVLTRTADNALSWDQRAVSANTSHATLYLALHSSATGHGLRVYTPLLPLSSASQDRSNGFLPWELAQSPYLDQSAFAANAISSECAARGVPVKVSAAALRPLNSVTTAAIAVEVAPSGGSAAELASPEYQQKVASTVAAAIAALRGKLGDGQ